MARSNLLPISPKKQPNQLPVLRIIFDTKRDQLVSELAEPENWELWERQFIEGAVRQAFAAARDAVLDVRQKAA